MKRQDIYLDGAANTPLDRHVLKRMQPFLKESFVGNSFAIHSYGIEASSAVEMARDTIAKNLMVAPSEIFFTSGATESNNWVIQSLAFHELIQTDRAPKKDIIISSIEHSSIMSVCKKLKDFGFNIIYINPNRDGRIDPSSVRKAISKQTLLVSIMAVNNETGVANDINKIGEIVHKAKSLMMSDCTQALSMGGKNIKLGELYPNVDYFTFSGHKIYGPTGTGCLIVHNNAPIYNLLYGGGQESGLRSGTLNTAGIVGLAAAVELMAQKDLSSHYQSLYEYTLSLFNNILCDFPKLNVVPDHKNIMSVNFAEIFESHQLAATFAAAGIACSAGSACDSETGEELVPSHVLTAMGLTTEVINNTVRLSFTKYTTRSDILNMVYNIRDLIMK